MLFSPDMNTRIMALTYMEQKVMESKKPDDEVLLAAIVPIALAVQDLNY